MAREPIILITGANGEVGHGLIQYLANDPHAPQIVVLDLHPLDEALRPLVKAALIGDILDEALLDHLQQQYEIDTIYHLAAVLSTYGEHHPHTAHEVNVEGTFRLMEMAVRESQQRGQSVKFIYPSSIAIYGLPDVATKLAAGAITEDQFLTPITMYGCNKLYCEHLGRYYTSHYMQLEESSAVPLDFRCVRFPGLISAFTLPSGGTSDYAPEMIHAAAQGHSYTSFVREDAMIPFMAMPDGVQAIIELAQAPRQRLTRQIYNVTGFSASAAQIAARVQQAFPAMQITYQPSAGRQRIVDSWPALLDDRAARQDWGWRPRYDFARAFDQYLIPNIRQRYSELAR